MPHWIVPYARTAFASGWAASGGPMTEHVRLASKAAIEMAIEHADDADVIEATLQLGYLEGVWALIYDRRAKLYASQTELLRAALVELLDGLDYSDIVRQARTSMGLAESQTDDQQRQHTIEVIAGLLLLLLLRRTGLPAWQKLRGVIVGAIRSGVAEGVADALALLAAYHHIDGTFDIDAAYSDALDQATVGVDLLGGADTWLHRLMTDLSTKLAKQLLAMAAAGATAAEMQAAVEADATFRRILGWFIDDLVHRSITQGALMFFREHGVSQVWWITAGDNKVCATCDEYEANSPYDPTDAPQPPAHPSCRCTVYTQQDLPSSLVDGYL